MHVICVMYVILQNLTFWKSGQGVMHVICVIYVISHNLMFWKPGPMVMHVICVIYVISQNLMFWKPGPGGNTCNMLTACVVKWSGNGKHRLSMKRNKMII